MLPNRNLKSMGSKRAMETWYGPNSIQSFLSFPINPFDQHAFSLAATFLLLGAAVSPYVLSIPNERSHNSRLSDLESRPSTRRREISRRPIEKG